MTTLPPPATCSSSRPTHPTRTSPRRRLHGDGSYNVSETKGCGLLGTLNHRLMGGRGHVRGMDREEDEVEEDEEGGTHREVGGRRASRP